MDVEKSFSDALEAAHDHELGRDVEFVVMGDVAIAQCPNCGMRVETSLKAIKQESGTHCVKCEKSFSIRELSDLAEIK